LNNKISVIIPIYNTYRELPKCLDSVCNQTYKNLEIICIDDGSSDGSEIILDNFANKDNRIIVVHQKNNGESNARNEGLKRATGDYVAFVDCDDWIDAKMYEEMISVMFSEDLDMVAVSWYKEWANQSLEINNKLPVMEQAFNQEQLLNYIYKRDSYRGFAYMWNKLYQRELLLDASRKIMLFDECLTLGGDVLYLAQAAVNVKKAKYINKSYYHYRQRESSGCHTTDLGKMKDWLSAYEMVIELFEKKHISQELCDFVRRFMAYHAYNAAKLAIEQNDDNWKLYYKRIMYENEKIYIKLNHAYPHRIQNYKNVLRR
jgi:glycosyltransferase involved in cell wall biosynthesis